MERTLRARGRLHGRRIDLDESIDALDGDVEVEVRAAMPAASVGDLLAYVATLPSGARSRSDVDQQVDDERATWDRRG